MRTTLAKDEMLRLDALDQYEVIDSAPEASLNELTSFAAELCGTPLAGISFVYADAVYFQSRIGPGPARLPRGHIPCEICIRNDGIYEVPDARYHNDFRPDGILIGGRAFRFYAGAPLLTPAGVPIGCLFVQDSVPHTLTERQRRNLLVLSRQVMTRLELNRQVRRMERDSRIRQRVEAALTVEQNFVSTVLDTVGALVAVFDTAGRIVRFNRTCEEVSGYEFSTLVGRYLWEKLIPAGDIQASIEQFENLRDGNFPASFENQWRNRDGSLRRIAWTATGMVDSQGQTTFIIATGIDVTVQREAEATLRESEARYRQIVEGSLGMICTHDMDGALLSVNTHGAESLGRTVESMVGTKLADFMPANHRSSFQRYLKQINETGEAQGRLHIAHLSGEKRVIAFRNKLIKVPGRKPYVLGFGVDITEQVRAEEKLRALIHQSNSILESVGDGILGVDLEGRVTVINPAGAQMLGYKQQELLGKRLHDFIYHARADGSVSPFEGSPISASITNLDTVRMTKDIFLRKDGSSFPVEYVARPQIDSNSSVSGARNKAIGVVIAFTDTTERRALDRMKDEFISTVSHELRTPLTSLRAALGLITGGALAAKPEKMAQMLEIAIGNTDRLIRLVNDILDIERISSGNAELHSTMLPVQALFERAVGLQQAAALKTDLRFATEGHGVQVFADPDRILQLLANLISNAIKFSPPGSMITLSAQAIDNEEAEIQVRDQGRGIPADKLEHIFERFQQVDASDSRTMGGTGLGLAICRSIIGQHGGRIWASSKPGQGSTFHFTLPLRPSGHLR